MVKNLPPMQKTWVPSLGQEDPQEEAMANHSSIFLPGESPRTEEPSATVHGVAESDTTKQLSMAQHIENLKIHYLSGVILAYS